MYVCIYINYSLWCMVKIQCKYRDFLCVYGTFHLTFCAALDGLPYK